MRNFIVHFETIIVFVISILLLFATDIAGHMLQVYMDTKLILVEEIPWTKFTKWMHKRDIAELVNITLLHMPIQSLEGVEFLLF